MGRLHCIPLRNAIRTPRATTLRASNGRDQQHVKPALPSRTLLSKAAQQSLNSEPGCIKVVDTFRVLRHTLAMDLLHHGVDRSVIALWLGHESVETTAAYLQADMELKEQALAKTDVADVRARRYKPDDQLLAFLKSL